MLRAHLIERHSELLDYQKDIDGLTRHVCTRCHLPLPQGLTAGMVLIMFLLLMAMPPHPIHYYCYFTRHTGSPEIGVQARASPTIGVQASRFFYVLSFLDCRLSASPSTLNSWL